MKENRGYILLESLISLVILMLVVITYVNTTSKLVHRSQERLASLSAYRELYNETRRCRMHSVKPLNDQITISFEKGSATNSEGGILIVKD